MKKCIIIGGGIAGLSAGIALQQAGINCEVYEAAPEIKTVGAGILLSSNALTVFDRLGIVKQIRAAGAEAKSFAIVDHQFRPIQVTDQQWIKEKYGFGITCIHRAKLQDILIETLGKDNFFTGKRFQSFSSNTAHFEDGSSASGDFFLGADGIHSTVRTQLFSTIPYRYTHQTCWRGIAEMQPPEIIAQKGTEAWGNQRRFGIMQVSDHLVYWFAVLTTPPGGKDQPATLKADLKQIFSRFHPVVHQLIDHTPLERIIRNDLYDFKPIPKWYSGNVCLIGDAAHATTPNMGQGGCQAIEDAWALLKAFKGDSDHEQAFAAFQQNRKAKTTKVTNQSFSIGKMAHLKYGQGVRNAFMRMVPASLAQKQMHWLLEVK